MDNFFSFLNDENINEILFSDIFFLKRRTKQEILEIKKKWLTELYTTKPLNPIKDSTDAIFFRSLKRDDYKKLFDTIISSSGIRDFVSVECPQHERGEINLDAISFLSKNSNIIHRINSENADINACLAIRICLYGYIASEIIKIKFRCMILFSDMQPLDHLVSILCNSQRITTVSAQHGLYIDYEDMDTVNVINYKHHSSNYFLAWGNNTRKLIKKHHPHSTVLICGKPDISAIDNLPSPSEEIIVVLDQEIFAKENKEMLSICTAWAKTNNHTISVKFHPHNNKQNYTKIFSELEEASCIKPGPLIVGHTSSLIFEAFSQGMRVLQYKTDTPTIPLNQEQIFSDLKSFEKSIQLIRNQKILRNNEIISYIGNDSGERYRRFFNKILAASNKKPFFTVIIPSYNSSLTVLDCIKTLLAQTFQDFEIIIIDGGSKDQTVQLIQTFYSNEPKVKIHCSLDKGIYDAMNKGISLASGEWLYFLGSDDSLYEKDTLEKVHHKLKPSKADFAYGSVEVVGDVKWAKDGTIYDGFFDDEKITKKNICHQAIFYRRKKFDTIEPYNIKYKLCADWDMNLRFWASFEKVYLNLTVAKFFSGGASTSSGDPEFGTDFKKKIEIFSKNLIKGNQTC